MQNERLERVREAVARVVCREARRDPDEICLFSGERYGKPFWKTYLGTADYILKIIVAEGKDHGQARS